MRVVLAGGTGFLGAPLASALRADGHETVVLSRRARPAGGVIVWSPDGTVGEWASALDGADAIVNLAGHSIAGFPRWTAAHKQRVFDSRVLATRSVVGAIVAAARKPRLLISASGVNYYGDRGDEVLTEHSAPGTGFLAEVCIAWEAEATQAERVGTRVAVVRSGVVLAHDGGALRQMMLPFRLFVGGPSGSGRQYLSWIHREDWIALIRRLLANAGTGGAFNASAPAPVTNEEFASALGRAMRRPSAFRTPAFVLRLALGEMAGPLLLDSLRVVPVRALESGFQFRYPTISEALEEIVSR
jgi:uncharacterized protein (TIGR01777 family)